MNYCWKITGGLNGAIKQCVDEAGEIVDNSNCIDCQTESQQWCRYFWELGVDNTFTSFRDTNATITFETNLGNFLTGSIPDGTGGWTAQVQAIAAMVAGLFPHAQEVNTYCQTPNGGNPIVGCGGLPAPIVYLPKMKWRYAGWRICPGEEYAIKATYTSDQRQDVLLDLDYQLTPTEYFDRCHTCGDLGTWTSLTDEQVYTELPACAVPNCGDYPETPVDDCLSIFDDGCLFDVNGDILVNNVTRLYKNCGSIEQTQFVINFGQDTQEEVDSSGFVTGWYFAGCDGSSLPLPIPECEDFTTHTLFTRDGVTGSLRNREWHDTGPTVSPFPTDATHGASVRVTHDFTLPTTTDTLVTSLILNDTDNTAVELDVQVIEGYIIVEKEILTRYAGASEGYWAIELGLCCGNLTLINESGGFSSTREMTFTIPSGIHKIRLWNIDSGGSNSSATFGYSLDGGVTYINDNTPPNITFSTTKPTEKCVQVKICKDGPILDILTGEVLESAELYPCKLDCTETFMSLGDFKTTCPITNSIPDANYEGAIQITTGRPDNSVVWELIDNRDFNNQVVIVAGNTFSEFSTALAAAGYSEFIEGELHYVCPCPPGLVNQGDYFVQANGNTVTKPACTPLSDLPNSPKSATSTEEKCALQTVGCLDEQILAALTELSTKSNTHLIEGCVAGKASYSIVDDLGLLVSGPFPLSQAGLSECCSDLWLLLSKCPPNSTNQCDLNSQFPGIIYMADIPTGSGAVHPSGAQAGQAINGWYAYAICSDTQPVDDGNGHYWIQGSVNDYTIAGINITGTEPSC